MTSSSARTYITAGNQPQMGAQLVAQRDPVMDQVFAGPDRRAQRDRGRTVRSQRSQPQPVGAQRVRQHKRVEPVVLVPRLLVW